MGHDLANDISQIGSWLKAARKAAGLTQEEAATKLGVTYKTIGRWERNEHPPGGDVLLAAARLYNADLSEVSTLKGDVRVPRGTDIGVLREDAPPYGSPPDEDSWSPNPALVNKIPKRAYEVAIAYCRRLQSGGWPRDEIDEIERLMIDPRYAQANKRKGVELSVEDHIMLIDATWEAVKHTAAALGRQV